MQDPENYDAGDGPGANETLELLGRIEDLAPQDNARLQASLAALRASLAKEQVTKQETTKLLAEYQEAYDKLTAPANRLGIFLHWIEGEDHALIALGDTEYVATVDPKVAREDLAAGTRVRVNEAYAVVGKMGPSTLGSFVKVSEALSDGRIRVGSDGPGGDGRTVMRSAELAEVKIQTGDEVRLDPSGRIALEHSASNASRDYFLESVPEIPWSKVGGQESAISLIKETIEQPLLHPEIFDRFEQKPVKGILLYGPPGCGKTLLGKATAYNLTQEYSRQLGKPVQEYFMAISGPKILNMWLGESERMVREIFKTARAKAAEGRLVFIFMDEAESILRTRSTGRYLNISNTVVPQFCAELDGLESLDNVILMLTSNRPDYIDPAVLRPGRIDRKVKINRPDREATKQILGIYLNDRIPLDPAWLAGHQDAVEARTALIDSLVDSLWKTGKETQFLSVSLRNGSTQTLYFRDLISGAILKSIVDRAKNSAIQRSISEPSVLHGISLDDLVEASVKEFKENEIFPKSDSQEDWLQLLDIAPENVASVRPIGRRLGEEIARKSMV